MGDQTEPPRYTMLIEWSDDDVFVVSLPEWGQLVHPHGVTYEEALERGKDLIHRSVAARRELGEPLPLPRIFAGA